jgi:hypothetical protein
MAEYFANALANIPLNEAIDFEASIPCTRGYVFHEDGTGVFILRGITNNCFARYRVTYTGNIAVPTGGTVAPIAVAIALNGEQRMASRAIITPAAVDEYGNVTSTAIITVPRGCCFSVSVRYVSGVTDGTTTPPVSINQINGNLTIDRIA